MQTTETLKCDFCESLNLTLIYDVPTSKKFSTIYACKNCGLVQTIYKQHMKELDRQISLSSDADWGNVRHGKKTRLDLSINIISQFTKIENLKCVLDIGSNRGHFVNYILNNSSATIDAIEPDPNILSEYKADSRLNLHNIRFENFAINKTYDLIYCCHTLEHADSASNMLRGIRDLLSDNGILYLDVPDIQMIKDDINIQEFFIDKHKFHFSTGVLVRYLEFLGLDVTDVAYEPRNIILICKKKNFDLVNKKDIDNYRILLKNNRQKLLTISTYIEELSKQSKVAIYGASQILNALIKYGNLNLTNINYLIDDFLNGYIQTINNKPIITITDIRNQSIDNLILLTRSSTNTILDKIKNNQIAVNNIISFETLMKNS